MFGNLSAEMARKGVTGAHLAGKLGMTPSTLSLKLNGKSDLSLNQAIRIKEILGVDIPIEVLFKETKNRGGADGTNSDQS